MMTTVTFEADAILDGIDRSVLEDYIAVHINDFCLGNILEKADRFALEDYMERRGYELTKIEEKI